MFFFQIKKAHVESDNCLIIQYKTKNVCQSCLVQLELTPRRNFTVEFFIFFKFVYKSVSIEK